MSGSNHETHTARCQRVLRVTPSFGIISLQKYEPLWLLPATTADIQTNREEPILISVFHVPRTDRPIGYGGNQTREFSKLNFIFHSPCLPVERFRLKRQSRVGQLETFYVRPVRFLRQLTWFRFPLRVSEYLS